MIRGTERPVDISFKLKPRALLETRGGCISILQHPLGTHR
jgi:hypothetical protein